MEKRARFGLVRTMSERSLDRKQFQSDKLMLPPLPLPMLCSPSIMTPQNEAQEEEQQQQEEEQQQQQQPQEQQPCESSAECQPSGEALQEYDNSEDNERESQFPSITTRNIQKSEQRRKEALWDLFQSECAFLYDHLMVLKNVICTLHIIPYSFPHSILDSILYPILLYTPFYIPFYNPGSVRLATFSVKTGNRARLSDASPDDFQPNQ